MSTASTVTHTDFGSEMQKQSHVIFGDRPGLQATPR